MNTKLNKEAKAEFTFIKLGEHERLIREQVWINEEQDKIIAEHDALLKELFKIVAKEKVYHLSSEGADQEKVGDNISPGSPIIMEELKQ